MFSVDLCQCSQEHLHEAISPGVIPMICGPIDPHLWHVCVCFRLLGNKLTNSESVLAEVSQHP